MSFAVSASQKIDDTPVRSNDEMARQVEDMKNKAVAGGAGAEAPPGSGKHRNLPRVRSALEPHYIGAADANEYLGIDTALGDRLSFMSQIDFRGAS